MSPRKNGSAAVIQFPGPLQLNDVEWKGDGVIGGTINEAELLACIGALKFVGALSVVTQVSRIVINTDSLYVKDNYSRAVFDWSRNQWKNRAGKLELNAMLWKELIKQVQRIRKIVNFEHVKAHGKSQQNRRADQLAKESAKNATSVKHQTVRRKITTQPVTIGSVRLHGQRLKIRTIAGYWDRAHKMHYYTYEVVSVGSKYFGKADKIWSLLPLRPGHVWEVNVINQDSNPMVSKVYGDVKSQE